MAMEHFPDNITRILGLHDLSARRAGELVDISAQTLSEWKYRKREPSLGVLLRLAEFFEISADRLVSAPFQALLTQELADPERFDRVEQKIKRHRRTLKAVESGAVVDITTGEPSSGS